MSIQLEWIDRSGGTSLWRWPMFARTAVVSSGGRTSPAGTSTIPGRCPTAAVSHVLVLAADSPIRRYRLTNREDYSLTYNGVVLSVDRRRADNWQAFASYTLSRAYGLQASSGASAAAAQVSTVGAPPLVFGRDPNDDLNARGRLSNDRPHMLRFMGATDVPGTGLTLAGTLQHVSGKPWAATALMQLPLPQSRQQRVLLEPRGSRRLSSQTLVDVRTLEVVRARASGSGRAQAGRAQRAR